MNVEKKRALEINRYLANTCHRGMSVVARVKDYRPNGTENDSVDRKLSTTERFYSVVIFIIFILCLLGIWKRYTIAIGVSLGILLILFHWFAQKCHRTDDTHANIISETTDDCQIGVKQDTIGIVGIDNERILKSVGTREALILHRSSLPSVTEVEIACHYFHTLDVINEVLQETQEDEGLGDDACELHDTEGVIYSGSSSPPTYTDVRYIVYTGNGEES